jgi:2-polyprenyl-3-methyl-5-hydroxy-6-metoxy-1,4-benzoquinol methylase
MTAPRPGLVAAACTLCGGAPTRPLFAVDGMRVVECARCGLRFFDPRPDDEALRALYRGDYFANPSALAGAGPIYGYQDYLADRANIRHDFAGKVRRIGALRPRGRLLEVGAAYGFFLEPARAAGWRVAGLEPNPAAAAFARDALGLDVRCATLEETALPAGAYDCVALFDVIEHLVDPRRALERLRGALAPGGLLVMSTIDVDSRVARALGPRWEDVRRSRDHLWLFSRRTALALLAASGFEVLDVTSYGKVFELGLALRRAAPYAPRLFGLLHAAAKAAGADRLKVHIDVRSKLCFYARPAAAWSAAAPPG